MHEYLANRVDQACLNISCIDKKLRLIKVKLHKKENLLHCPVTIRKQKRKNSTGKVAKKSFTLIYLIVERKPCKITLPTSKNNSSNKGGLLDS